MRPVILALIILISSVGSARAQCGVASAGKASTYDLNTECTSDYADIYARQLDYGEQDRKFHAQLKERQRNFDAPRAEAYKNYQKSKDALRVSGNVGNQ